jgi:nicotinate phosphoribosyltransferase
MTLFNRRRLAHHILQLDTDGLQRGDYTDRYFANVTHILTALQQAGYTFGGKSPRGLVAQGFAVGDVEVEAQVFTRRKPSALIVGVDVALQMLRHATGQNDGAGFIPTWQHLEVEAIHDGDIASYDGDSLNVQPVLKIRGRYRDFAMLETPLLGYLTRGTRIASQVYEVLKVSNGKGILFFPARFDLPQVQSLDGYAYWVAVERYNQDFNQQVRPLVSTDAQAAWWGGRGGGTIPHALIACFLADTAETMQAFAWTMPLEIPRIALVDFNNDVIQDSLQVLDSFWPHYLQAWQEGDDAGMKRWTLNGVRVDTAGNMRDVSLGATGETGVNVKLVMLLREALNNAWSQWGVPHDKLSVAQTYCKNVQIIASGGFNAERIAKFESLDAPVDSYGVGSTFLMNTGNTDFTMDIVRVKLNGEWVDIAKLGRASGTHPNLQPINLGDLP